MWRPLPEPSTPFQQSIHIAHIMNNEELKYIKNKIQYDPTLHFHFFRHVGELQTALPRDSRLKKIVVRYFTFCSSLINCHYHWYVFTTKNRIYLFDLTYFTNITYIQKICNVENVNIYMVISKMKLHVENYLSVFELFPKWHSILITGSQHLDSFRK